MKSEVVIRMKSHQSAVTWEAGKIKFVCNLLKKLICVEEMKCDTLRLPQSQTHKLFTLKILKTFLVRQRASKRAHERSPYK